MERETPLLSLVVRNRTPLDSSDIGELLSAFSSDYSRIGKGRGLSIVSLQSGSLFVVLTDAALAALPYVAGTVAAIAGANTLHDFFQKMKRILSKAKADPVESGVFQKKRKIGMKSVERIIDTAIKSGAQIEVSYRSPDGEELTISVSSDEAQKMRQIVDSDVREKTKSPGLLGSRTAHISISDRINQTIEQVSISGPTEDTVTLVEMLVDLLKESSAYHVIDILAERLDQAGQVELAQVVRNRGSGKSDREMQPVRN